MTAEGALIPGAAAVALFLVSAALTEAIVRLDIADVPNARSSHRRPTPKGGGLAVALSFLLGLTTLLLLKSTAALPAPALAVYLLLAALVAGAGLIDDVAPVRPALKLAAQIFFAGLFATTVARLDSVSLPGLGLLDLGHMGGFVTILWIVAVMNFVNFMDGINGLVAGSALIAAAALAILASLSGAPFVSLSALALASATAGFFVHNFPFGRIFLGDTGSQFLGFMLATLAVIGASEGGGRLSALLVPILLLPLLFDAALTLVRRALRGENVTRAHRDHIYQILVQAGLSHAQVSGLYFSLALLCAAVAAAIQVRFARLTLPMVFLLLALLGGLSWLAYRFAKGRKLLTKS